MLYLGCHLSSSGGFAAMGRTALAIGANTFQFFTRNPRGGQAKAIDPADAQALAEMQRSGVIGPIVAHAPYTINPCAAAEKTLDFARQTMKDDLARMEYLPGNFYNFHPGSHVGQGTDAGIRLIAETLDFAMTREQSTTVLLETMAGKGTEIGGRFSELRDVIDRCKLPEKLGVCLDTCHVHDAGYDIVSHFEDVLAEFDRVLGLSRLRAIHLNDSKNPLGARKDRHECIGRGELGLEALERVLRFAAARDLPVVLETPNDLTGYAAEIALLRNNF
ncbi:MAG: deoxyribonuclease IV [Clostridiales bacterium]|nr:deoxyribonuclease IV [Clostridiales bacterium]